MATDGKKLDVIVVEHENGVLTAFIKQFPGVLVQCKSKYELQSKIDAAMDSFIARLQNRRKYNYQEESLEA